MAQGFTLRSSDVEVQYSDSGRSTFSKVNLVDLLVHYVFWWHYGLYSSGARNSGRIPPFTSTTRLAASAWHGITPRLELHIICIIYLHYDGLAAILGHEIAHNVARHQAEQLSSLVILAPVRWAFIYLDYAGFTAGFGRVLADLALNFGLMMPASRKQESEADYIGLMMMAKACYDPKAAVKVWQRMEAANKSDIPQWLSTHPTNNTRIEQMTNWLPKAEAARDESGCAVTMGYAKDFQETMGRWGSFGNIV
ncbi:Mitochondrial metalloendopeptidase, partial [Lachnellula hyalina]